MYNIIDGDSKCCIDILDHMHVCHNKSIQSLCRYSSVLAILAPLYSMIMHGYCSSTVTAPASSLRSFVVFSASPAFTSISWYIGIPITRFSSYISIILQLVEFTLLLMRSFYQCISWISFIVEEICMYVQQQLHGRCPD